MQLGHWGRRSFKEKPWPTWARICGLSPCPGCQGNLQRCKQSLGVGLTVSKLLWERRAHILQQAIPLCLSFCLSVLNSPSALIHSHIQFPALSIHQSPHFVSADFITALAITLQPSPGQGGTPPHPSPCSPLAAASRSSPSRVLLTEGPAGCLSFSIAQASKNTNTQPDSYRPVFHLSYRGECKRNRPKGRRGKGYSSQSWGEG